MTIATNLGYPRIGPLRELKKSLEGFWRGKISEADLMSTAKSLRAYNWTLQKNAGIQHIPSNDFSYYDQVLDMIATVGAVPARYGWSGGNVDLETYFAMARGIQNDQKDVPAMEMTKWFDTNYHFIVPEFEKDMTFKLSSTKIIDEYNEAKALGIQTRPVIIGPVTFMMLGKAAEDNESPCDQMPALLAVYAELLQQLSAAGAEWIQIDEPCLVLDLEDRAHDAYKNAYKAIREAAPDLKILVSTYFESIPEANRDTALSLGADALHLDLVRGSDQLGDFLNSAPSDMILSLGVVDGRNIWRADLEQAQSVIQTAIERRGAERIWIAPSCSLLHTPYDLELESDRLDDELKSWMAFAKQKLSEIAFLANPADSAFLEENKKAIAARNASPRIHSQTVKDRLAAVTPDMAKRRSSYEIRKRLQSDALNLPLLPTTTIGSFPQTQEIRQARAKFRKGEINDADYKAFLQEKTEECIRTQEEIGLDVLVHGEFERNDMVEYFGENLSGFAFTSNGWVQSYGSRCVKPPIIFGDVSRPEAMTVEWAQYAQSMTDKPMKGMLTGPITIMQWSFVRNDQPRETTCKQIALAIRDEVVDLESAGIGIIQIDEAAIREGLPLRRSDWAEYLRWAVESFRLTSSGVKDETQIHTHMCYSEFNDIIDSVGKMDADVTTIETSRSHMELLDAFATFKYPNDIGPGVYDIHSPRVPSIDEITDLLDKAVSKVSQEQIWVNPDCGLKTRDWPETKQALVNMVTAAKQARAQLKEKAA